MSSRSAIEALPPAAGSSARVISAYAQPVVVDRRPSHLGGVEGTAPGLKGKNLLVTGGSSGIGQAIAVRFAAHGANA
jgi:hypothetical protein